VVQPTTVAAAAAATVASADAAVAAAHLPSTPVQARTKLGACVAAATAAIENAVSTAATGKECTLSSEIYGYGGSAETTVSILERHRHRYEVNPERVGAIEATGLYFSGRDESGVRMEVAERARAEHPFFLGESARGACLLTHVLTVRHYCDSQACNTIPS
jgi:CTP synthase (UTP-ammonia lyase)